MKKYAAWFGASLIVVATAAIVGGEDAKIDAPAQTSSTSADTNQAKLPEVVQTNAPTAPMAPQPKLEQNKKPLYWLTTEVVKMSQAGIQEPVIKSYIENSPAATIPTADDIVYLRDNGLSSDLVITYIRRGQQLQAQAAQATQTGQAMAAPMDNSAVPVPPPIPVPTVPPDYYEAAPSVSPADNYGYVGSDATYVSPPPAYYFPPPYYSWVAPGPYFGPVVGFGFVPRRGFAHPVAPHRPGGMSGHGGFGGRGTHGGTGGRGARGR